MLWSWQFWQYNTCISANEQNMHGDLVQIEMMPTILDSFGIRRETPTKMKKHGLNPRWRIPM
jgi:hypothetical protein